MGLIEHYGLIKAVHISCAVLSIVLFILRGVWVMRGSSLAQSVWARKVPHYIDTLFLGSAVVLAMTIQQYPFVVPWLTAKVVALVVYILLGAASLRLPLARQRNVCFFLAIGLFGYIVSVALTKQPMPWLPY